MGDAPPNLDDRAPGGPEYTMYHTCSAGRDLQLLTELIRILPQFRFLEPQRDTILNETYRNSVPFVEDIVYYMSNPIPRGTFRFHLLYIRNMITTANTQNEQHGRVQQSYNEIISNIDELLRILRFEAPQGTNTADQESNSASSALQWTALERLMNLMDKHVDTKYKLMKTHKIYISIINQPTLQCLLALFAPSFFKQRFEAKQWLDFLDPFFNSVGIGGTTVVI